MKEAVDSKRIIIIGAGPCGLGAAYKLKKLGYKNWAIYEKEDKIGGLSSSFKDEKGFTWDIGGHVFFSSSRRFIELRDYLLREDFLSHNRESWIKISDSWVPYPFQNNISRLPKSLLSECLSGLIQAQNDGRPVHNFEDWIYKTFGVGIAGLFMIPYNLKMWTVSLDTMSYGWIKDRISPINIEDIIKGIDDVRWGPNNKFKFPKFGGTGGFFNKFEPFVRKKISYKKKLVSVDVDSRTVIFDDGTKDEYDILINTSPIDLFIKMVRSKNKLSSLYKIAAKLKHNSIYVVGIGLKEKIEANKCWVYFPERKIPFYRLTYFSRYSPYNVPGGNDNIYSSLMCEVSFSEHKRQPQGKIVDSVIKGLLKAGILSKDNTKAIVSRWCKKVDYGYPIPTLGRDNALKQIQPFLENNHIYSRGRFGGWKYEVANMDHSVLMGIELVERILLGKKESIWTL